MTTKKITRTIELTVEQSERVFAKSRPVINRFWCPICQSAEDFAAPATIAVRPAVGQREIFRRLEKGELGFAECADGAVLVCVRCFEGEKYEK